jgi:hypothetical protein
METERIRPEGEQAAARELRRLARLFPTVALAEVQAVLGCIPLRKVSRLASGEEIPVANLLSPHGYLLTWQGRPLELPYRVYFQEPVPGAAQLLTNRQRQLLHCVYLRHHDGFVRQRHLEQLLASAALESFTTPCTFSLLSDYVQEILEVLSAHLIPVLLPGYVRLIKENPRYWSQTQGRVASYWDIYYRTSRRGSPQFRHYVGNQLLKELRAALQEKVSNQ